MSDKTHRVNPELTELSPAYQAHLAAEAVQVERVLAAHPGLGPLDWPQGPTTQAPEAEDADLIEQAERSGDVDALWRAGSPRPAAEWGAHSAATEAGRAAWLELDQAERKLRELQGHGYGRGRGTGEAIDAARAQVADAKARVLLTERGYPGSPAIVALVLVHLLTKLVQQTQANQQDIQALASAFAQMEARTGRQSGGNK